MVVADVIVGRKDEHPHASVIHIFAPFFCLVSSVFFSFLFLLFLLLFHFWLVTWLAPFLSENLMESRVLTPAPVGHAQFAQFG